MLSGADWEAPRSHLDLGVSLCGYTQEGEACRLGGDGVHRKACRRLSLG